MKTFNFKKSLFLPFLFLLIFSSCQKETTEITDPNNEETLVANSNLANLMRFTATNDGSVDNIIDFANCLEVQFPVVVIVNDITITINSLEDLDLIEDIFDEFEDDENDIEIVFPITIISSDYTEVVIESQEELDALIEECSGENEDDDDIECIDFQYPITISIYNTDFEVIETVTISDDEALYNFIEDLEGGVLASINFPVTMILSDGSTLVVENNTELEAAIEAAEDECDEDDDYDWDDDDDDIEDCDINLSGLELFLVECHMEAYIYDASGNIIDENDLNFNADGELVVNGEPTVTELGTWSLSESVDGYILTIDGLVTFNLVNGVWLLEGCNDDGFVWSQGSGSDVYTMELEQDCTSDTQPLGCLEANSIVMCDIDNDGYEVFNLYEGLSPIDDCEINNPVSVSYHTSLADAQNNENPIASVTTFTNTSIEQTVYVRIELFDDPSVYEILEIGLILEDCSGSGTIDELESTIIVGQWIVANYNDSGVDETDDYNNFVFDFNTDGSVTTTNGTDTYYGTWSAIINDSQLKLVLDFGTIIPFDEFNDDWDVISLETTRLELRDVSGGTGEIDVLVFEKL
jgi:hypothetical protein